MPSARTDKFNPGKAQRVAVLLLFFCGSMPVAAVPAFEIAGVATGAVGIGVSEFYKAEIVAKEPRWTTPPEIDASARSGLKWSNTQLAKTLSDVMLFGVMPAAAFASPLATNHEYGRAALTVGEAVVITGVITQVTKFSVARARPFAYYSNDYSSPDSKLSFFSGHTSYSFAMALSSAMLMAESYPNQSAAIYATAIALAALPGYLRIAADKHYLTDVLVGAIIGSGIAYGITRMQLQTNSVQYGDERRLQMQRVFVLP
ncbi:MAG: phosphatase PAP2 family protein [Turneriella sp.]|nr:phosphatase PAP2 family protein [Turneriella sp.]